jgi:hypothetical protein
MNDARYDQRGLEISDFELSSWLPEVYPPGAVDCSGGFRDLRKGILFLPTHLPFFFLPFALWRAVHLG